MLDRFGRGVRCLRVSVTERCNLRCRYCMPEGGAWGDALSDGELVTAVEAAASLGITKLRVTGGEPLVRQGIVSLCRGLAAVPGIQEVCLTTNGILLPGLARPLREAGVRRVNLSLDTLDPEKYAYITKTGRLSDFFAGLDAALAAGFEKVKLNAVLLGGFNDDEIPALAALTKIYPVDVRFIEWMPMHGGDLAGFTQVSGQRALDALPEAVPVEPEGLAERYRLPGALGCIGLIRPVTAPFCAACDRLRLTADGWVKPCLHDGAEYPLRGLSQEEMRRVFQTAIEHKPPCHGTLDTQHPSGAGRNMNRIGG